MKKPLQKQIKIRMWMVKLNRKHIVATTRAWEVEDWKKQGLTPIVGWFYSDRIKTPKSN